MARIQNVDYEAIPGQAAQIRQIGQELNQELTTAYSNIANMHSVWYGKRYNSLVGEFNKIVPQINELLQLVIGDFPMTLEIIANNYSQADTGANVTSPQITAPNKIAGILLSVDIGMRFLTSEVQNIQSQVSSNLDNAKAKMDQIQSVYNQIQWQSEASETFKAKFTKLKLQITESFENIKSQFTKLMNQTQEDIQSAESSNTVG